MHRLAADLVVGMEQRLGQQVPHVRSAEAVKHSPTIPASLDQASKPEFGEMLAGHRWPAPGRPGKGGHVGVVFT